MIYTIPLAVDEIKKDFTGIQKKDILYMGNDYRTDVEGAVVAGLDVAWYNVVQQPDEKEISTYNIRDFKELLKIISL